ncbi:MAG: hypothetical protein ACRCVZ_13015 [Aestuariivirga sp.]
MPRPKKIQSKYQPPPQAVQRSRPVAASPLPPIAPEPEPTASLEPITVEPAVEVTFLRGAEIGTYWPNALALDDPRRGLAFHAARNFLSTGEYFAGVAMSGHQCKALISGREATSPFSTTRAFLVELATGDEASFALLEPAFLAWCRTKSLQSVEVIGVVGSELFEHWPDFAIAPGTTIKRMGVAGA